MAISVGVLRERAAGERRVAATPESLKKLAARGLDVRVAAGAGEAAGFLDQDYESAGARVVPEDQALGADVVLCVVAPPDVSPIVSGKLLIGFLAPHDADGPLAGVAAAGGDAIAIELLPRISRAQGMDALSSQANIAGYRAVIEAASRYQAFVPLMMTAAGTSRPAKVIVLGVGVAGLQAIATARRLGAQVEAFDVRPETREQVLSLGAKFIDLDLGEEGVGEGGYAAELSDEAKARQQQLLTERLQKADIIITTALVPGRPAPQLVSEAAVDGMRVGSVIIDLAAATGGNVAYTRAGEVIDHHGITIVGLTNFPSLVARDASSFYARNLLNLLDLLIQGEGDDLALKLDTADEIIDGCLAVQGGTPRRGALAT